MKNRIVRNPARPLKLQSELHLLDLKRTYAQPDRTTHKFRPNKSNSSESQQSLPKKTVYKQPQQHPERKEHHSSFYRRRAETSLGRDKTVRSKSKKSSQGYPEPKLQKPPHEQQYRSTQRRVASHSREKKNLSRMYRSMDLLVNAQKVKPKMKFKVETAFRTRQGKLISNPGKVNQDVAIISQVGSSVMYAVGDGHGANGHLVSGFIKQHFVPMLSEDPALASNPQKALSRTFKRLQSSLVKSDIDAGLSGSTLCGIFLREDHLFTANAGDSRAILCRKKGQNRWEVSNITRDHKPNIEAEKSRIIKFGGKVDHFKDEFGNKVGPARVWLKNQRVPGLAMSRSIGDNLAKEVGVICLPQVLKFDLQPVEHVLVVASDGIWDYISKEDIAEMVVPYFEGREIERACDKLLQCAVERWTEEDDDIVDDITFVLIFLRPQPERTA